MEMDCLVQSYFYKELEPEFLPSPPAIIPLDLPISTSASLVILDYKLYNLSGKTYSRRQAARDASSDARCAISTRTGRS